MSHSRGSDFLAPLFVPSSKPHTLDNSGNMNGQEGSARGRAHTLAVGENLEKNNGKLNVWAKSQLRATGARYLCLLMFVIEAGDHVRGVDRTASFLLRTYYPGKNEDGTTSSEGKKF